MKKEALSVMTVKTLLAVIIFAGVGTIIVGGGYIIANYSKWSELTLNPDRKNIINEEHKICQEDSDCELRFSGCDCRYYCLKKGDEIPSCSKMCDREIETPVVSECICENNKCVKEKRGRDSAQMNENSIQSLIQQMGNDNISQETKNAIPEKFYDYGKEAIPYLIEALDDERVFDACYVPPSGALTNYCVKLLVKSECHRIIRSIVTPVPSPKVVSTDKGYRFYYRVDNWQQWWDENQDKSLNEIRKMVRDYYRAEEEKNNYSAIGYRGEEYDYLDFIGNLTSNDWEWDIDQNCHGLREAKQCDYLDWPISYGGCRVADNYKCYNCVVSLNGDVSACEKIILENKSAEDFYKNGCYHRAATALDRKGMNDKIDFCDKFKGEWKDFYKEKCLKLAK